MCIHLLLPSIDGKKRPSFLYLLTHLCSQKWDFDNKIQNKSQSFGFFKNFQPNFNQKASVSFHGHDNLWIERRQDKTPCFLSFSKRTSHPFCSTQLLLLQPSHAFSYSVKEMCLGLIPRNHRLYFTIYTHKPKWRKRFLY